MDGYSRQNIFSCELPDWELERACQHSRGTESSRSVAFIAVKAENLGEAIRSLRSALPSGSQIFVSEDHRQLSVTATDQNAGVSTSRQLQILALLKQNLSNKEIGRRLNLSHFTVRNHVSQLLRIFNVSSRKDVVRLLTKMTEC